MKESGFESDQAKSLEPSANRIRSNRDNCIVLGTEATVRDSMLVDNSDTSVAKGRMNEALVFEKLVEKANGPNMNTRKTEALSLITSK